MPSLKTSIKIERRESEKILIRGIWGPALREWRDVVEDYIYVSRKRFDNKLSMFKLQLEILQDIYESENSIRIIKDILKNPENIKNYNTDMERLTENDKESFERQLYQETILIKALKGANVNSCVNFFLKFKRRSVTLGVVNVLRHRSFQQLVDSHEFCEDAVLAWLKV